jgi:hypothetical protein
MLFHPSNELVVIVAVYPAVPTNYFLTEFASETVLIL